MKNLIGLIETLIQDFEAEPNYSYDINENDSYSSVNSVSYGRYFEKSVDHKNFFLSVNSIEIISQDAFSGRKASQSHLTDFQNFKTDSSISYYYSEYSNTYLENLIQYSSLSFQYLYFEKWNQSFQIQPNRFKIQNSIFTFETIPFAFVLTRIALRLPPNTLMLGTFARMLLPNALTLNTFARMLLPFALALRPFARMLLPIALTLNTFARMLLPNALTLNTFARMLLPIALALCSFARMLLPIARVLQIFVFPLMMGVKDLMDRAR